MIPAGDEERPRPTKVCPSAFDAGMFWLLVAPTTCCVLFCTAGLRMSFSGLAWSWLGRELAVVEIGTVLRTDGLYWYPLRFTMFSVPLGACATIEALRTSLAECTECAGWNVVEEMVVAGFVAVCGVFRVTGAGSEEPRSGGAVLAAMLAPLVLSPTLPLEMSWFCIWCAAPPAAVWCSLGLAVACSVLGCCARCRFSENEAMVGGGRPVHVTPAPPRGSELVRRSCPCSAAASWYGC
mmetsp:Transcript_115190/g.326357  ORF Transcript_115190/g.326357 Transcript_115190/m.326357 type:complete len:238 (+) Transcript_115190:274-987(+)